MWLPSVNGQRGIVCSDASFDVPGVPVVPGTNTLTATYTGPAFTNVPMTATDTSTVVLGDTAYTHDANGNLTGDATFTYQYDLANQLTNVIRKADSVSVLQWVNCKRNGQLIRRIPGGSIGGRWSRRGSGDGWR